MTKRKVPRTEPASYVILWTGERIREMKRDGWLGKSIPYLFGGPHLSHPSMRRAGVMDGDRIFPLAFRQGQLSVICECLVRSIIPLADFCALRGIELDSGFTHYNLQDWLGEQSWRWLAPTCTDEAVVLESCSPIVLERYIPQDRMKSIRFLNSRGERTPRGILPDGRLKNVATICGRYYRVSKSTGELLAAVVREEALA